MKPFEAQAQAVYDYILRPQAWQTFGQCPDVETLRQVMDGAVKLDGYEWVSDKECRVYGPANFEYTSMEANPEGIGTATSRREDMTVDDLKGATICGNEGPTATAVLTDNPMHRQIMASTIAAIGKKK
jgi:hypothetical protein